MPTSLNQRPNEFLFWPRNSRDCFWTFIQNTQPSYKPLSHLRKPLLQNTGVIYSVFQIFQRLFYWRNSYIIFWCVKRSSTLSTLYLWMCGTSPVWEELTALWSWWQLMWLEDHFLYLAKIFFFVFLSSWPLFCHPPHRITLDSLSFALLVSYATSCTLRYMDELLMKTRV